MVFHQQDTTVSQQQHLSIEQTHKENFSMFHYTYIRLYKLVCFLWSTMQISFNKKLSRCWSGVTCVLLDALIIAAKVQNSHIFHTPLAFLSRIWITGYYDLGPLPHAGSPDNKLLCYVPISTFCCITWSQSI